MLGARLLRGQVEIGRFGFHGGHDGLLTHRGPAGSRPWAGVPGFPHPRGLSRSPRLIIRAAARTTNDTKAAAAGSGRTGASQPATVVPATEPRFIAAM